MNKNKKKKISFGLRAKIKLANVMNVGLESVETDKGELFFVEGDALEVGTEVFVHDEEGAAVMPADGDYKFGDKVAVVKDGIVEEIKEAADGQYTADVPSEVLDTIAEIIEDAVEEIKDGVNAEIEEIKEALKKTQLELSATKKILERAKLANAKDFADPNPNPGEGGKKMSKGKEALKAFGL